tara:strand:+ start:706 stop:981 length:276 start_codon:yes stop_codon:yes gene_type:complete
MVSSTSRNRDLKIGDLVTHVLYGHEWIGMILEFKELKNKKALHNKQALVQIQPGTKYEGFFRTNVSRENKINDNLGYVSANWLFKIEVKKV